MWHWRSLTFIKALRTFSYSVRTLSCCMWDLILGPGIEPGPPAGAAWSLSQWDHQGNSFLGTLEAACRNQSRRRAYWQDNKILLGSRAMTSHLVSGGRDACISLSVLHFFLASVIAGPQSFTEDDLLRMSTSQELSGGCYPVTQ